MPARLRAAMWKDRLDGFRTVRYRGESTGWQRTSGCNLCRASAADEGSNGSHIDAANGMTMKALARQLEMRLNVPVVDMTETSDYFVVNPAFTAPNLAAQSGGDGLEPETPAGRPVLFTALQEQAGLRLESMKVSVPTVIVDSVEKKPTGN